MFYVYSGVFFGIIGFPYFIYGKQNGDLIFLITGMILMTYPYFVNNKKINIMIGIIMSAFPFLYNRFF